MLSSSSSNNERLSKRVGSIATVYNTLSDFIFVCESLSFLSVLFFFYSLIWFIPFSSLRASEPGGGSQISRPHKEKKKVNTRPQQNTCKSVVLELTVALYIWLEAGIVQFMLMVCKKKILLYPASNWCWESLRILHIFLVTFHKSTLLNYFFRNMNT